MTEKMKALMVELAERMLAHVQEKPRWPGIMAKTNLVDQSFDCPKHPAGHENNLRLFKQMDEDTNKREIAYWEAQVRRYKGGEGEGSMNIQITKVRREEDKRGTLLVQEFVYLDGPLIGQTGSLTLRPFAATNPEGGDVQ